MCSHLRNLASAVDQYSSSRPASLILDPKSECNLNKFFSSFESASRICSRERTRPAGRHTQDGRRGMCSDILNPGGEVRGCCVDCILACQRYHHLCLLQQANRYMGFLELKKCFFKRGCFGCGEVFWCCSDWHEIVILFPPHLMPV